MSQLVPCPSCGRHVRLPSASCPFCDVAINTSALTEQYAPRRSGVQSGIKRAVIFAVGASMAAACGGETDEPTPDPDPTVQPVYGAPVDPTSGNDKDTSAPPDTTEPTAQPLYGAPVTSEPTAQPVYGAPINCSVILPQEPRKPGVGNPFSTFVRSSPARSAGMSRRAL